ncbi:hypothetical protein [Rubellicoccus peritrichatus]|uniref:DUF115 domain-containing protein n=1 Tax=Rubellicoccus peritrichatus TaxID=3080537 RepID=A0AAQ3LA05_9BACT|nr:hypothetical protein [Puniceicoccus sp. CR14]WOO41427.1 hypothetical protein RZN69_22635 [Puniceicoccus sp. CR14]
MKSALKHAISEYILPPGITRTIKTLTQREQTSSPSPQALPEIIEKAKSNVRFKDIHKGERCFILATGPSVKDQNLKNLANEYCISVSHFYLHPDFSIIKPNYHVIAPAHPPFESQKLTKLFQGIKSRDDLGTEFFLGQTNFIHSTHNFLCQVPELKPTNFNYINYTGAPHLSAQNHQQTEVWDISRNPFSIRTVVYSALQLAAYMGFSKVFLLGADMNHICTVQQGYTPHFYKEEKGINDAEQRKNNSVDMEKMLLGAHKNFLGFRLIREHLEGNNGMRIYNCSPTSLLDVFERIDFNDAIKQSS